MWFDYVKERLNWETIEIEGCGFICYEIRPPVVVMHDIYIAPEHRKTGIALELANQVTEIAKVQGCAHAQTQVWPGTAGAERAMSVDLAYGFKMISAQGGSIVMQKDI